MHCNKQKPLQINFGKMYLNPGKKLCACFGNHNATTDICKSILWYNENIQIDKKTFFFKSWYDNNIFLVNTLINKDGGGFLSYNQFTKIYGGVKTNFLDFFS